MISDKEGICSVCGKEIHKDEETDKMEIIFGETWRDNGNKFGSNKPWHWHTNKKEAGQ